MKDMIVVITGATRGFGYAIAEAMLNAGATVVISGRSRAALKKAGAALGDPKALTGLLCDVRKEKQVYALARQVLRRFGRIDVWINNAGYSASAGMILDTPPTQAVDMFMANDMGTLYGCQAALRSMLKRKSGTLVNIYGNGSFLRPASPTALYGTTKAWVTSLTRSLAQELKGSGVQILGFSPGMILTDMLTAPTVLGARGRDRLKNYTFVLRLLAGSPSKAAEELVRVLQTNRREFAEVRLFKPWTPLLGLLRVAWENLTHTGRAPKYKLKLKPAYKPKI
jgi:NAD(P)-dependent dehydrogenase (short-subunit alcohol dehydrogenase family)